MRYESVEGAVQKLRGFVSAEVEEAQADSFLLVVIFHEQGLEEVVAAPDRFGVTEATPGLHQLAVVSCDQEDVPGRLAARRRKQRCAEGLQQVPRAWIPRGAALRHPCAQIAHDVERPYVLPSAGKRRAHVRLRGTATHVPSLPRLPIPADIGASCRHRQSPSG